MSTNQASAFLKANHALAFEDATVTQFWNKAVQEGAVIEFNKARFPDGSCVVDHCGYAITAEQA